VEKIYDIRKNIKESIVVLLSAMHQLDIPLEKEESEKSREFILKEAGNPDIHRTNVSLHL
jgi:hypothetical protein